MYFSIYILWMNLIFNILGPFIVLATLNHIVYRKIKEFETRLTEGLGVCLKTTNSTTGQSSNGGSNGDRLRYHPHHHSHMASASNGRNSLQPPSGHAQVSAKTRSLDPDRIV